MPRAEPLFHRPFKCKFLLLLHSFPFLPDIYPQCRPSLSPGLEHRPCLPKRSNLRKKGREGATQLHCILFASHCIIFSSLCQKNRFALPCPLLFSVVFFFLPSFLIVNVTRLTNGVITPRPRRRKNKWRNPTEEKEEENKAGLRRW